MQEIPIPALPCPECREAGRGGKARIGNNRSRCATCNNFAQNVMRRATKLFKNRFEDEYTLIRVEVEKELYAELIRTYTSKNNLPPSGALS